MYVKIYHKERKKMIEFELGEVLGISFTIYCRISLIEQNGWI